MRTVLVDWNRIVDLGGNYRMEEFAVKAQILTAIAVALMLTGCLSDAEKRKNELIKQRRTEAWEACLSAGGVPNPAWYDSTALGKCQLPYPPEVSGPGKVKKCQ